MDNREKLQGDIGEEIVNILAFNTYLKYWCFSNPRDEKGSKKEICDLLILFKNTAIIFSIKNYSFDGNYERYFRSTLEKALKQLSGAERKLFNNPNEVFITHKDLGEIKFDPTKYNQIHRIIINHNITPLFYPGGKLTPKNEFAHIFNWEAFSGVVNELDTIPDFITYLQEREIVFRKRDMIIMNGKEEDWNEEINKSFLEYNMKNISIGANFVLISGSELDLLADYYWNERKFHPKLYSTKYNGGSFEFDGNWEKYKEREEVKNKKSVDRFSYFVDEFVKREVLYSKKKSNLDLAIELLSLNRFERRILGASFFEFVEKYKNTPGPFIARRYGKVDDLVIALVLYTSDMEHKVVMQLLSLAAEGYCVWDEYQSQKIAIIGVSEKMDQFRFGFMKNIEPFPTQYEKELIKDLKLMGWFTNIEVFKITHKEYPDNSLF